MKTELLQSSESWSKEVFGGSTLGDSRLLRRLQKYAAAQVKVPRVSTAAAWFVESRRVSAADVLQGPIAHAAEQCRGLERALSCRLKVSVVDVRSSTTKHGPQLHWRLLSSHPALDAELALQVVHGFRLASSSKQGAYSTAWFEAHAQVPPTAVWWANPRAQAVDAVAALKPRASLREAHDYWFRGGYPEPWLRNQPRFHKMWMESTHCSLTPWRDARGSRW